MNNLLNAITSIIYIDKKPVGTCFFINQDILITCKHCLISRDTVEIHTSNKQILNATLVQECELNNNSKIDIAILKAEEKFLLEDVFIPISSVISINDELLTCGLNYDRIANIFGTEEKTLKYSGNYLNNEVNYIRLSQDKIKPGIVVLQY